MGTESFGLGEASSWPERRRARRSAWQGIYVGGEQGLDVAVAGRSLRSAIPFTATPFTKALSVLDSRNPSG
jgi:hypothetical protein